VFGVLCAVWRAVLRAVLREVSRARYRGMAVLPGRPSGRLTFGRNGKLFKRARQTRVKGAEPSRILRQPIKRHGGCQIEYENEARLNIARVLRAFFFAPVFSDWAIELLAQR
jgi:hypothetical protein